MVKDLLSEHSLKERGLYNPAYVAELIQKNDSGQEDNAYILWTLLTNEIWFRTFFSSSTRHDLLNNRAVEVNA
jgi:asparagine synthase (glutamine-hydrolysing)